MLKGADRLPFFVFFELGVTLGVTVRGYHLAELGVTLGVTFCVSEGGVN